MPQLQPSEHLWPAGSGEHGSDVLPITGDESVAYTVTATVSGIGLVEDIVIAKKGDVIVAIDLGDVGSVDTSQLQQFVSSAMNKVT